jgi:hypothetical protein
MHTAEDADKFKNTCRGEAVVTNNGKGLAYQRNSALEMLNTGEWGAFFCDDFNDIRSYPKEWILSKNSTLPITFANQSKFKLGDSSIITFAQMFEVFPKLIEIAEKNNIHLIGFGLTDNPMFLRKKFNTRGLADGRAWLVKKSNYRFDTRAQLADDVAWTAENLVRHRNVLILNWIVPLFKRYSSGGFGSIAERLELRRKECAYIAQKYDPLVKIAKKANWEYGTHIRIYGSDGNIDKVRKRRGFV